MMKSGIHSLAEYNSGPGFLLHGSVNASPVNVLCGLHDLTQSEYQSSLLTVSYTLCLSLSPPPSIPPSLHPSLSVSLSLHPHRSHLCQPGPLAFPMLSHP